MANWYCIVNGLQYGPVDDEALRGWAAQGRLQATDMVWTDGMSQWRPAGEVGGLFAQGAALAGGVEAAAPGGSAGPSPYAPQYGYRWCVPHRGVMILIFGILGIVCCVAFGIAAWIMGRRDLKRINAGEMDPAGRGLTNAGYILGIVGTVLGILGALGYGFYFFVMLAAGAGRF